MTRALILVCVLLPAAARAQQFEIAPLTLAGYTTGANIEEKAATITDLKIDNGWMWGAQGGFIFPSGIGVEIQFRRQKTGLSLSSGGQTVTLFYLTQYEVDGNLLYQFAHSKSIEPFVSAGVGGTFFSSSEFARQSFPAWNAGVGVKWYFLPHVGARIDGRYRGTFLNTGASNYCVPFSFCQRSLSTFEFGAGAQLRF
jgi:hypothetical protein